MTLKYKNEYFPTKYIPVEIEQLQNLETLSINLYDLEELPKEIYNLTRLKKLTINRCHNIKTLPIPVKRLSSLKELSLSYLKNLDNLGSFIHKCPYLETLKLQSIQIEKLPKSLYELKGLKKLILPARKTVIISQEVSNLINLEFLECHINEISEEMCLLPKLKFFSYGNGELEYIPSSINNIISLGYISINGEDNFETVDTLYNKELLKQGFQIVDSYDEYIQEYESMKVITHHYKKESTIKYIPNTDYFKQRKEKNNCIKRVLNIAIDDDISTLEQTEEEIEFEIYMQNKQKDEI